jgi:V8-like Glu-specific endopeptidase
MATGWLIKDDLLVTAGHCSFDWSHKMGRLVELKAYIGYDGKDSITDPYSSVQFRKGVRVATTSEWLRAKGARAYDVAFVKLDRPFTGVVPIKFVETPRQGDCQIGVVGYPGDRQDAKTSENGAHMYEMFTNNKWNLEETEANMIEYEIDTYGGMVSCQAKRKGKANITLGNSGSPVLREDLTAIGAHVYGGSPNSASVIGVFGNPYQDYIAAFDMQPTTFRLPGVPGTTCYVRVPTNNASQDRGFLSDTKADLGGSNGIPKHQILQANHDHRPNGHGSSGQALADEGFFDIFRKAVQVGAPILSDVLQTGLPLALGPIGAPLGALANLALSAAGRMAESTTAESGFTSDIQIDGTVERAILSEAALAVVMSMKKTKLQEEGILDDMASVVKKLSPSVGQIAPHVMGAVMEPALRIALDTINTGGNANAESSFSSTTRYRVPVSGETRYKNRLDPAAEAFVSGLLSASAKDGDAEGFFDDIGKFIKTAVGVAAPLGGTIMKTLGNLLAGTESGFAEDSPTPIGLSLENLGYRAILGEAALQAVMKMPKQQLEEEGFFSKMISLVKDIAPVVMRSAPGVIKAVTPLVNHMKKQASGASIQSTIGKSKRSHQRGISHANIASEFLQET